MARWVSERTVETIEVPVTIEVPLREVTVEAAQLRSPGGTKPMRRRYQVILTPNAALYCSRLASKVHRDNVAAMAAVDREFQQAEKQKSRNQNRCAPP